MLFQINIHYWSRFLSGSASSIWIRIHEVSCNADPKHCWKRTNFEQFKNKDKNYRNRYFWAFLAQTLVNICKEQICNKLRNEALVGRVHWKEEIWWSQITWREKKSFIKKELSYTAASGGGELGGPKLAPVWSITTRCKKTKKRITL